MLKIREMRRKEFPMLRDFLHGAIFVPEGMTPPDISITDQPELKVYTENFGNREGDMCLVCESCGEIAGAVWCRIMNDYGHVDDDTPSFALSVREKYRRRGIGTTLMKAMIETLRLAGYKRASLSVQKANFAVNMYKKLGFEIFSENDEEYIMLIQI
ncbi:MAG: GNAT family N-acetyltransferase [Synergistaceae bacterium]|nr:GNAT family N-acetyltransferase [Synergistaceae bacterium]